jgi:molybdate transport repressor ModE-like protein
MVRGTRRYKELIPQQLRSLCETARQGSLAAAAKALDLSQPTVWKQVHALERDFGVKLVEPHGRGCAMTAAGQRLIEMIGPTVEAIDSIRERFRATLADEGEKLTVALTPRLLLEDFALCMKKYHRQSPKTRLTFLELPDEKVAEAVLERRADFGFTPIPLIEEQLNLLSAEPAYPLEVRLIAPKDHPLARKRQVRPGDLARYPLINRPPVSASTAYARFVLELQGTRPGVADLVHVGFASSIRRYVKLGYGIGLLTVAPPVPPDPELHERSMRRHFGDLTACLIRRRGGYIPTAGEEFIRLIRQELGSGTAARD